jgi:hypothetical protein
MLEILSPLASANQEGMDVERFTAELSGLAAGRQTLFDEMARLAKPDVRFPSTPISIASSRLNRGLRFPVHGERIACPTCASRWSACIPITHRGG